MSAGTHVRKYFIDTSALLKAYIPEKGSDAVDRILDEEGTRSISSIGLLETVSVFQRLHSVEKTLSRDEFGALCREFFSDVASGRLVVVGVTPDHIRAALALEIREYLTAVDAVQVAVAMGSGDDVVFVASDGKLNRAARERGLHVFDPAEAGNTGDR